MGCKKEFIKTSKKIHENKYDYSKVIYKNGTSKVIIICPAHGKFLQSPNSHKKGHGCPECSNCKKLTTKKFIEKSKKIHGNKYDYSKTIYRGAHIKVKIICPIHGEFFQTASNHINTKCACPNCANIKRSLAHSRSILEYINLAKKVHRNKYDYSKVLYKSAHKKIIIICPIHGKFLQSPNNHLKGCGCQKCRNILLSKRQTSTTDAFIRKANLIHNHYYDYSLVKYKTAIKKVKIICPEHGVFLQTPNAHLNGSGCPRHHLSKGELKIINWLTKNNIKFISQKSFNDLIGKNRKLYFDFYLPRYGLLIEYDGQQHFKSNNRFTKNQVNKIKKYDKLKNNYCIKNKILLFRIPYTKFNKIEEILKNIIFKHSEDFLIRGLSGTGEI